MPQCTAYRKYLQFLHFVENESTTSAPLLMYEAFPQKCDPDLKDFWKHINILQMRQLTVNMDAPQVLIYLCSKQFILEGRIQLGIPIYFGLDSIMYIYALQKVTCCMFDWHYAPKNILGFKWCKHIWSDQLHPRPPPPPPHTHTISPVNNIMMKLQVRLHLCLLTTLPRVTKAKWLNKISEYCEQKMFYDTR